MATKRKVGNLLALAVLAVLIERPMHRYEIVSVLRERGKERDMSIKWGSLYTVVQNLEKAGFLEVAGRERDGARPERIIYRITAAGTDEAVDWTRELVAVPERNDNKFIAGLSILALLPPDEVIILLGDRLTRLEETITAARHGIDELADTIPRLFLIEGEYDLAMLAAEATWVREFRDQLSSGAFGDVTWWRQLHATGGPLPEAIAAFQGGEDTDTGPA